MTFAERLLLLQDPDYRDFQAKLMPTVDAETIIGVRTPELRKLAKQWKDTVEANAFLSELPHRYYEENNLHGCFIEHIRDFEACILALDQFLPYVDNWATCDMMHPKVLNKDLPGLLEKIRQWVASGHTYTVRFGMLMLMRYYLEEEFSPAYLELVASVSSEEYYVNMMQAWFFATALAKQYEYVLPWLQERRLSPWVHHKTIQKAVESYRITAAQKTYLKTLR